MNRQQRRVNKSIARKSKLPAVFAPTTDETAEVHAFSVKLQEAVHVVIQESGYHDVDKRREMVPRIVHGLGMTTASFAIVADCTEEQLIEAMRVYYRQVRAHVEAIQRATAESGPRIIMPGEGRLARGGRSS